MNVVLWIVQIVLAAAFGMAGFGKVAAPMDQLAMNMDWVSRVPSWAVRMAGAADVLGAVGLVLPTLTRIRPGLTPLAAVGLVAVMLLAAFWVHVPAGEWTFTVANLVLAAGAAFVAYGRLKLAPVEARS